MKQKRYLQACEISGSIYGKKRQTSKGTDKAKNIGKKDIAAVYNRFYKEQVSALYRALHSAS